LLGRLSGWRLDPAAPEPTHRPNILLRGLLALHLHFEQRRHA